LPTSIIGPPLGRAEHATTGATPGAADGVGELPSVGLGDGAALLDDDGGGEVARAAGLEAPQAATTKATPARIALPLIPIDNGRSNPVLRTLDGIIF
jgi:hypothetical protein